MAALGTLLSPEDLQGTLSTLEVLLSLFSEPSGSSSSSGAGAVDPELLSASAASAARDVAAFLSLPLSSLQLDSSAQLKARIPNALPLCITLDPLRGQRAPEEPCNTLTLDVELPLRTLPNAARSARPRITLRQAGWMSRAVHDELCSIPALAPPKGPEEEEEDAATLVLAATEELSELSVPHLEAAAAAASSAAAAAASASQGTPAAPLSTTVLRTWHLFPSLSTPSKRDDLVSYASLHAHAPASSSSEQQQPPAAQPLTGFVLAGKPGLVVLEAALPANASAKDLLSASNAVDAYWADIKSRSWRDIPSGHKKVSERLREPSVPRVFSQMQEMTDRPEIGGPEARKGTWSHRNDLGQLEAWLESVGLGGRMKNVLGMGTEWTAHGTANGQ